MMLNLEARNVNGVWPQALRALRLGGKKRGSRNGEVVEYPTPVTTTYDRPMERVLFDSVRDCNPFLHLFESLWILAGRNDVEWPAQFASNLRQYSDNGKTFHGAYGHRLRRNWGRDQIAEAVRLLRDTPDTRRAVLSLWDPAMDLGSNSLDVPCNTTIYCKVRDGRLFMTVGNRSNDIVWGLYGANVVQWSVLQEYLALKIGVQPGPLTTLSDSFHAYQANKTWQQYAASGDEPTGCPYEAGLVYPWPLMDYPASFDQELSRFLNDPEGELDEMFPDRAPYRNSFFWKVAHPLYLAWKMHKRNGAGVQTLLAHIEGGMEEGDDRRIDWIAAAEQWLQRREGHAGRASRPTQRAGGRGRATARRRTSKIR